MKHLYFLLIILPCLLSAQYTHIPLHSDIHDFARRLEISGKSNLHSGIGEFSSRSVFQETIDTFESLARVDQYIAAKLVRDYPEFWNKVHHHESSSTEFIDSSNTFYTSSAVQKSAIEQIIEPQKKLLKYFYSNRNYFAQIKAKGFSLKVNPIVFFGGGRDLSQSSVTFENRRGIAISGQVNDKVFFYTDILESQAVFPSYINNYVNKFRAVPGNGFYKNYRSGVIDGLNGYDFLNATAYINAKVSKNIGIEFGNNNQFLGNGNRSLLLSDFTNNYLYLKFNTKIWKLHYQNIFAELIPISTKDNPTGTIIPRKYMTTHYLSFKHQNIELGIFESVIFERDGNFDLQYLNPIILYRLVEYNLASSDNVLIGLNGKWNFAKRFQLYGQLLVDEFKVRDLLIERNGWWANKFGIQAGIRYIDAFGLDNLDLGLEYNRVRPYTFGHGSGANYSHANQALAHPLGANFEEFNFTASHYLSPRLSLTSNNYLIRQGLDTEATLYGADVLRPSSEKPSEFGNNLLQGASSRTLLSINKASYELLPNYFLEANLSYRSQVSDISSLNFNNLILSGAIRINFWEPKIHL